MNFIAQFFTRKISINLWYFRVVVFLVADWKVYEAEQSAQLGVASIAAKQEIEVIKFTCSLFWSLMPHWVWKDGSAVVEQVTVGVSEVYAVPLNTSM